MHRKEQASDEPSLNQYVTAVGYNAILKSSSVNNFNESNNFNLDDETYQALLVYVDKEIIDMRDTLVRELKEGVETELLSDERIQSIKETIEEFEKMTVQEFWKHCN
jgi:hypothetical protein